MPIAQDTRPPQHGARLSAALARLDALINWERRGRGRMRVTLDPARDLCRRLGNPQTGPRVVHVAGSKGKGSVASLIATALGAAGLRTGRYASPHVERVHERVVVDGREVSDDALADGIERALAAREAALEDGGPAAQATWFDLLTAAAWCAFAAAEVEWLVAECGLGGRFDSTNTLAGEVCVITNVELEHTSVLGATRAAIAGEKAGILERGSTLVTGVPADDEAGHVIDALALEGGVRVRRPGPGGFASIEETNRRLAGAVLDELARRGVVARDGTPLGAERLSPEVVRAARLPGRMERLRAGATPVVVDGAHTPASARAVLRDLSGTPAAGPDPAHGLVGRPVVVLGLARDKDLEGLLKSLRGGVDRVICTSVDGAQARLPGEIEEAARRVDLAAETAATPRAALERALELAGETGWVLVLGSLYLAGAVRPLLENADPPAC